MTPEQLAEIQALVHENKYRFKTDWISFEINTPHYTLLFSDKWSHIFPEIRRKIPQIRAEDIRYDIDEIDEEMKELAVIKQIHNLVVSVFGEKRG